MATIVQQGDRFLVGDDVIVDCGPARKQAEATPELLSNAVTADHYTAGKIDALGKPIVLGESMTYLDWLAPFGWYVYLLDPDGVATEVGYYDDKDDALAAASEIADTL
jgi:hypothetical protein